VSLKGERVVHLRRHLQPLTWRQSSGKRTTQNITTLGCGFLNLRQAVETLSSSAVSPTARNCPNLSPRVAGISLQIL
jgi:hypothetical protein